LIADRFRAIDRSDENVHEKVSFYVGIGVKIESSRDLLQSMYVPIIFTLSISRYIILLY
jgi:hypothetical protein